MQTLSVSTWSSVLSSMLFDCESGDSINGASILFSKTCKLPITFLSSVALLNTNDSFAAILIFCDSC